MSDDDPEVVEVAKEWLRKADGDYSAATVLLERRAPAWTVCFHAQQTVEKYVKSLLVLAGTRFGKTHDIDALIELLPASRRPPLDTEAAVQLTRGSVASRYPEAAEPSVEEAERLLRHAKRVREFVRSVLPREMLEP